MFIFSKVISKISTTFNPPSSANHLGDTKKPAYICNFKFRPDDIFYKISFGELEEGVVSRINLYKRHNQYHEIETKIYYYWNYNEFNSISPNMFKTQGEALNDWKDRQNKPLGSLEFSTYEKDLKEKDKQRKNVLTYGLKFDLDDDFFVVEQGEVVLRTVKEIDLVIEKNMIGDGYFPKTKYRATNNMDYFIEDAMFKTREDAIESWVEQQKQKQFA